MPLNLVQLSHRRLPAARSVDVDAGQAVLIDRLVPLVGRVQRDVQKDHLLVAGLLFDLFQIGYCPDAGTAPTRPKVQENRLPSEIAQGDALALEIVEGEVGRGLAGFELGCFPHDLLDGLGVFGIGVVLEEFG